MGSPAELDFFGKDDLSTRRVHIKVTNPDNYSQYMSPSYVAKYFWVNTLTPSHEWIDDIKAGPSGTCLKVH